MKLLKFVYRGLMTGMPLLTYNPMSNVNFHGPFTVSPKSLYINYKLSDSQRKNVENYINEYDNNLKMEPIRINDNSPAQYYLSLNIYNCTSPLFLNDNGMTRFEINTYVTNGKEKGTLILDYISSALSMDPVNIFKTPNNLTYTDNNIYANDDYIKLNITLKYSKNDKIFKHSSDLTEYSDYIFYKNGIYDKLFYDTSLVKSKLKTMNLEHLEFNYLNISFVRPENAFYFLNEIYFVGSMWDNLKINE